MRISVSILSLAALALATAIVSPLGRAADDPAALVQKRIDLMKSNGGHLKDFGDYTKGAPYSAKLVADAQGVAENAAHITALFPPGSVTDKSRAKPEIWQKWSEFEEKAKALNVAATKLAEVAKSDDKAAIGAQLKLVGGACGGCHDAFRGPEKK